MKFLITLTLVLLLTCDAFTQTGEINRIQQSLPHIKDTTTLYVDVINRLAFLYYEKNPDSTFSITLKARALSEKLNYEKGQADALNNLGLFYYIKGNYQLSLRYYNDALTRYAALKDTSNVTQLLMNISLVFYSENKMAKSFSYMRNALQAGQHLQHDSIMALVYLNHLMLFPDSTDKTTSYAYLQKAETIAHRYEDERLRVTCMNVEALLLLHYNEYDKGVALLKESAMQAEKLGVLYVSMDMFVQLGDVLQDKDSLQAAKYYNHGLDIAAKTGFQEYEKIISQKLYEYYLRRNDLANQNKYANLLISAYKKEDSLSALSSINYIDYALKEKELQSFKQISYGRRKAIIILGCLSLLILAMLFYIYRSFASKRKLAHELQQLNNKVSARNKVLQTNNEFNNKIVSILAHDFRQPLANMKNIAMLLREYPELSPNELEDLLTAIENTSASSLEIFENILQWIKQQLSGFHYVPVSLNVKSLYNEAAGSFKVLLKQHHITVQNEIAESISINGDKEMLQFVNRNLIHNAIKFSPGNSIITLHAAIAENEIIISVKDEGKGMSAEKIKTLFDVSFERSYDSEKEKGAGIALIICKDFIEKMGGRIWVISEQNKGTTFLYAVPLQQ